MDREFLLRILQIAVVGPFIYKVSTEQDSDYFRIGLKLLAGSIIITNARPLLEKLAPIAKNAMDIYLQQNGYRKEIKSPSVIDGEFVNVTGSRASGD